MFLHIKEEYQQASAHKCNCQMKNKPELKHAAYTQTNNDNIEIEKNKTATLFQAVPAKRAICLIGHTAVIQQDRIGQNRMY